MSLKNEIIKKLPEQLQDSNEVYLLEGITNNFSTVFAYLISNVLSNESTKVDDSTDWSKLTINSYSQVTSWKGKNAPQLSGPGVVFTLGDFKTNTFQIAFSKNKIAIRLVGNAWNLISGDNQTEIKNDINNILNNQINPLKTSANSLSNAVDQINKNTNKATIDTQSASNAASQANSGVSSLNTSVEGLDNKVVTNTNSLNNSVSNISNSVSSNSSNISSLHTIIDNNNSNIDINSNNISSLNNSVNNMSQDISSNSSNISSLSDDDAAFLSLVRGMDENTLQNKGEILDNDLNNDLLQGIFSISNGENLTSEPALPNITTNYNGELIVSNVENNSKLQELIILQGNSSESGNTVVLYRVEIPSAGSMTWLPWNIVPHEDEVKNLSETINDGLKGLTEQITNANQTAQQAGSAANNAVTETQLDDALALNSANASNSNTNTYNFASNNIDTLNARLSATVNGQLKNDTNAIFGGGYNSISANAISASANSQSISVLSNSITSNSSNINSLAKYTSNNKNNETPNTSLVNDVKTIKGVLNLDTSNPIVAKTQKYYAGGNVEDIAKPQILIHKGGNLIDTFTITGTLSNSLLNTNNPITLYYTYPGGGEIDNDYSIINAKINSQFFKIVFNTKNDPYDTELNTDLTIELNFNTGAWNPTLVATNIVVTKGKSINAIESLSNEINSLKARLNQ